MKKSLFFIPVIALVILLTMTQCKKDYNCGLKVVCYYTTTGLDTGKTVAGANLDIYPGSVASGRTVHPAIEAGRKGVTDKNGVYEHTYPYEALLNISATFTDTVVTETGYTEIRNYRGTAQVKLQEGQTVEKAVLMMLE
jgi:hypothetical protein